MKSFQSALHALSFDPTLARLFATTPWPQVSRLGDWVAATDPYGEGQAIVRALDVASASGGDAHRHVEHQLWCAWRQAAWTNGLAEPLQIRAEGLEWLAETEGKPTLLVTPMTLAPGDAMNAIAQLNTARRPCVVFGEDIGTGDDVAGDRLEVVSGMSGATVRRILEVLAQGGVLCTYPDFVYEGRTAESIPLFDADRPVSSGFLSLAARHGTMLLPLACFREDEGVLVHVEEPVEVQADPTLDAAGRGAARALVANAVGDLLEGLIRLAPEQWLLLPTLTFESPEMARARATQDSPA